MSAGNNVMESRAKIFAGPKVRRLRRSLGLSQTQMASELDFSVSYLNLVERDQRPISAQLLLRLAEVYDVNISELAGNREARAFADMREILSDPLFKGLDITKAELQEVAGASPAMTEAMTRLYKSWRESVERSTALSEQVVSEAGGSSGASFPNDQVRNFLQANQNYFPELDEAAELLFESIGLDSGNSLTALSKYLQEQHGITVRVMPSEILPDSLRHFDRHRRQLMLSELLRSSAKTFQAAYLIGLLEYGPMIDRALESENFEGEEAPRLARISLANYFAGALIMPYTKFRNAAEVLKYDVEHLAQRYNTSFEQTCHRLTTLQRPGKKGVPFFFIRLDAAGNVSKRFSAGTYHFSRFGGTCPLWNVHDCLSQPGRIGTQIIQMPDGTTYFSVARSVERGVTPFGEPRQRLAVALACDIKHARKMVYAKGHDLTDIDATPVGPNCKLCERPNCAQRAHPPLSRKMVLDERSRGVSAYRFSLD